MSNFFCGKINNVAFISKRFMLFCPFKMAKPRPFHQFSVLRTNSKSSKLLPFEVETKLPKDVMLFKNENSTFCRIVSVFGVTQLIFWVYLGRFSSKNLKDVNREIEEEQIELKKETNPRAVWFWEMLNFSENKYKIGISTLFFSVGYVVAVAAFLYTLRSVRYIVLLKGGEFVRIITYAPVGARRITVPLNFVSSSQALSTNKPYYPIKIKGYWFYFLLDMKGELMDKKLFENTIGISRSFKKM